MDISLIPKIRQLAQNLANDLILWRRHLHMYPELSGQEFQTATFIREILTSKGIPFYDGVAGTGIVGIIQSNQSGKGCIALRADMDALPIQEISDEPWRSQVDGVMHACGHDAHITSLLGTAILLNELRDTFRGTIKLFFQPAEERFPGGAKGMIDAGVLENPKVDVVFGQHVIPSLDTGVAGFKSGASMAATNELYLTITGKGGHGATPEMVRDPVLATAHILLALQQIVSRKANPQHPTVLSFGRLIADGQVNIIPNEVQLHGILRTYDEPWRQEAHQLIRQIASDTAKAHGVECDVMIQDGYPSLINHTDTTQRAMLWAQAYLGQGKAVEMEARMTAEDFAYFSRERPSCFYRLGVRNETKGIPSNLHTPSFDIDEDALPTGAGLMTWIAIQALQDLEEGWNPRL